SESAKRRAWQGAGASSYRVVCGCFGNAARVVDRPIRPQNGIRRPLRACLESLAGATKPDTHGGETMSETNGAQSASQGSHAQLAPVRLADAGVIVTGAARGIGAALARAFAAEGARVVVNDVDADGARVLAEEL